MWTASAALIHIELSVGRRGLRAAYAVRALLGGSLFTLADYAVELSMFPAASLGRELVRAAPEAVFLRANGDRPGHEFGSVRRCLSQQCERVL